MNDGIVCMQHKQFELKFEREKKKNAIQETIEVNVEQCRALQVALLHCCTVAADLHAILPANLILIIIDNCGQQTQQKLTFIWLLCCQTRD